MIWEPEARDGPARAGKFKVGVHEVETPALLVVVDPDPRRQLVPLDEIRRAGAQVIMTSAFIAKKKVGLKNLKEHLGWDGLLYTDSGTFQAYSRGARVDPEESVRYQISAGSDIITPVDVFSLPTDSKEVAKEKAEASFRRWLYARELKEEVSAPVQGGLYPDVRAAATRRYAEAGARLLAVGGIVPLMEEYKFKELVDVLVPVLASRPPEAAVHAFGAGHPLLFPLLAFLGVDAFDSAMYAIAAREGRYLTPFGTFRLEELVMMREFPCDCPACSSLSPRDLLSMSEEERVKFLALHNLYAAINMVKEIRERIIYGSFHKWALAFAHTHPRLYEAFAAALKKWRGYFERERNALPKSPVPEGCELCDSSPEKDPVEEGTYAVSELFAVLAKRAYGKELTLEEPLESLKPPRVSFSTKSLRELCSVRLASPPKGRVVRKKDLKEVRCVLRPNQEALVVWEGGEARAVSAVSFAELSLASGEAVVLLLSPEGLHGVQPRGLVGRVEASDHGGQ